MEQTTEIRNICEQIAQVYRDKMNNVGYDPNGELMKFTWVTEYNGNLFELYFNLPDYFDYAEYGRGPTLRTGPGDVRKGIENWVRLKHLIPRPGRDGKIPSTQQMIYAITRKIHKEGFEGKHLLEKSQEDSKWVNLVDTLEEIILNQIENELEKDIEQI